MQNANSTTRLIFLENKKKSEVVRKKKRLLDAIFQSCLIQSLQVFLGKKSIRSTQYLLKSTGHLNNTHTHADQILLQKNLLPPR